MFCLRPFAILLAVTTLVTLATTQVQAQNWSTIKGQIILKNAPAPKPLAVAGAVGCVLKGPLVDESLIVNPKNDGVKYVVVWLRPNNPNRKAPFPANMINPALAKAAPVERVIDQPCCQFEPRVLAAREGDTLVVKNSAAIGHNVKMSADDPAFTFNVNLPAKESHAPKETLQAQFSAIPFECNVHTWMNGYLRVFDHPYFAVTDDDGKFEIKDAPVGNWNLVIWQENGFHKGKEGILGMPIVVKAGGTELPAVELKLP